MSGARGGVHDLSEQAKARFFPHDLDDDWRSPDLGRFGETASSSARRLLSACEALWRADADEGRDLANGSVYAGTCGAALLLYKLAMMTNDDPASDAGNESPGVARDAKHERGVFFGKKRDLLVRALSFCRTASAALHAGRVGPTGRHEHEPLSFLEGEAGAHAVTAAVHFALGDVERAEACARRLAALRDRVMAAPKEDCELLYGRCGYLHALLFARRRGLDATRRDEILPVSLFASVAAQVVEEGLANDRAENENENENENASRAPRLAHAWRGKRYLGAAHGACGIVTTLLQCSEEFGDAVFQSDERAPRLRVHADATRQKAALDETLSRLLASSFADGNLPSSESSKAGNALVQWCHGAPGLVVLLAQRLRSAIVSGEASAGMSRAFLAHRIRVASECVWRRGLTKKGPGLCHGASGNGYALLVAARAVKPVDPVAGRLLEARAKRFALWVSENAIELASKHADNPGSLFEGLGGAVAFVADAADPTNAWFPGSEA